MSSMIPVPPPQSENTPSPSPQPESLVSEKQAGPPPKNWKQVPALAETKIDALFTELREIDAEIAGLSETREKVRGMIAELVQPLGHGVIDFDLLAIWVPKGKPGKKLDEAKLVQAGVTPDQLAAGYKEVAGKKAHLLVRAVEPADESALNPLETTTLA